MVRGTHINSHGILMVQNTLDVTVTLEHEGATARACAINIFTSRVQTHVAKSEAAQFYIMSE